MSVLTGEDLRLAWCMGEEIDLSLGAKREYKSIFLKGEGNEFRFFALLLSYYSLVPIVDIADEDSLIIEVGEVVYLAGEPLFSADLGLIYLVVATFEVLGGLELINLPHREKYFLAEILTLSPVELNYSQALQCKNGAIFLAFNEISRIIGGIFATSSLFEVIEIEDISFNLDKTVIIMRDIGETMAEKEKLNSFVAGLEGGFIEIRGRGRSYFCRYFDMIKQIENIVFNLQVR